MLFRSAKTVFTKFGLSFGYAVNIFIAKVAMEKRIPFDLSLPSEELEIRAQNIDNKKNIEIYETANELFEELGI